MKWLGNGVFRGAGVLGRRATLAQKSIKDNCLSPLRNIFTFLSAEHGFISPFASAPLLCFASPAFAQSPVEWRQVLDISKRGTIPKGISAGILGIAIGDSLDEARTKVEARIAARPEVLVVDVCSSFDHQEGAGGRRQTRPGLETDVVRAPRW